MKRPRYGTYLTWGAVLRSGGLLALALGVALAPWTPWWGRALGALVALDVLLSRRRIWRAARTFAADPRVHEEIRRMLLDRLSWDGRGRLLDIGTGSGLVAIGAAVRYPEARVVGTDTWDAGFVGLSREACLANARLEGVADRTEFERADAVRLPYADGSFEAVVSNSVFHLVRGSAGARAVLWEALRVLAPGGAFSFNDIFQVKEVYGDLQDLADEFKRRGYPRLEYAPMSDLMEIPCGIEHLTVGSGVLSGIKGQTPPGAAGARDAWLGRDELVAACRSGEWILPHPSQNIAAFRDLALELARGSSGPIVLVGLESLGFDFLARALANSGARVLPVTSVAPTTAATAWTSIFQGSLPREHGVPGTAFLLESAGGTVSAFAPVRYVGARSEAVEVREPFVLDGRPSLFEEMARAGRSSSVLLGVRAEILAHPWMSGLAGGARAIPFEERDLDPPGVVRSVFAQIDRILEGSGRPRKVCVFAYLDFDDHVHSHGTDGAVLEAVHEIRRFVAELRRRCGAVALGVSDHGVVRQSPGPASLHDDPEILARSRANPGGAGRTLFFYARPGEEPALAARIEKALDGSGKVFTREEYLARFHPGPARGLERIGDLVAVATSERFPSVLRGAPFEHGSHTVEEMLAAIVSW